MTTQRTHLALLLFTVSIFTIMMVRRLKKPEHKRASTIGIIQTASHPALDAVREGFVTAVKEKMGDSVDFIVRNGQGSISTIHTIAQQFHAKQDADIIFAIATPAAQAILSVEKERPIIIGAVTVTPELADNFSAPNICGVNDMIDVRKEIQAMKELLPKTAKTVGIVFSSAEVNSVAMSKIMVAELERAGYEPQLIAVASELDMEPAVASAVRKVDVLLCPTDNVVANSIALIANIAAKAEKPLIVSDNLLVWQGALMARGIDYYESGKQAGEIALQIIEIKKKPQDIGIITANSIEIYVNKQVLGTLGLSISDAIASDVVLVNTQM